MEDVLKYIGTDAARGSIAVAARTASVNGSGVDLAGYDGAIAVAVMGAAWAAAQGSHTISIEESTDNSTFAAPAATNVLGSVVTISGQGAGRAITGQRYVGTKRYIRAVGTAVGSTDNCTYGVNIIRCLKRHS